MPIALFLNSSQSAEAAEGLASFAEKHPARWKPG
jgi:hypothetical protein